MTTAAEILKLCDEAEGSERTPSGAAAADKAQMELRGLGFWPEPKGQGIVTALTYALAWQALERLHMWAEAVIGEPDKAMVSAQLGNEVTKQACEVLNRFRALEGKKE